MLGCKGLSVSADLLSVDTYSSLQSYSLEWNNQIA